MFKEFEGMGLSPEELAALEEKDEKPEPKEPNLKEPEDPKPDDEPDEDPEPDDEPADDPEPKEPADDPEPKEPEDDGYEHIEFQDFQPFEVRHVPDFDVKMADFDKQRSALVSQFKDGELTLEDFLVKDREIKAEEDKLRDAEREASTMDKLNEQTASRTWFANVKHFIGEVKKAEGLNYENPTLNAALDNAVKTLANDKANADKPQAWFLREAHRIVKADLGLARQVAPKGEQKPESKPEKKGRAPDLSALPKTLAKVPAAASNDPKGDDEFAGLDQLEGMELEAALFKMTPEQVDRYLRT